MFPYMHKNFHRNFCSVYTCISFSLGDNNTESAFQKVIDKGNNEVVTRAILFPDVFRRLVITIATKQAINVHTWSKNSRTSRNTYNSSTQERRGYTWTAKYWLLRHSDNLHFREMKLTICCLPENIAISPLSMLQNDNTYDNQIRKQHKL